MAVQPSKLKLVRYSRAVSDARRAALIAARAEQIRELESAKSNVRDLQRLLKSLDRLDQVDDWFQQQLVRLGAEAEARRARHRTEAGRAVASMRGRGQHFARIAAMSGTAEKTVRALFRHAAAAEPEEHPEVPAPPGADTPPPPAAPPPEHPTLF